MAEKKTVAEELQNVFELQPNEGESVSDYARRLASAANDMTDEAWQGLTTATQKWVNAALEAVEKNETLPLPSGVEALMPQQADAGGLSEEVVEGEKGVASNAKSSKNGAAKAAPKAGNAKKPAATKAVASVKTGGKKAAPKTSRPGPRGNFETSSKIKLAKENPYREGTKGHSWFALYKSGMMVETAIAAGVPRAQVRWDVNHGNITLSAK